MDPINIALGRKRGGSGSMPRISLEISSTSESGTYPLSESESAFFTAAAEKKQDVVCCFDGAPFDGRFTSYGRSEEFDVPLIIYITQIADINEIYTNEGIQTTISSHRFMFVPAWFVEMEGDGWACIVEKNKYVVPA